MENEIDTSAKAGTDTVQPEQTDTIPDYVYFDPDEDTEESEDPGLTDDDGTGQEEEPEAVDTLDPDAVAEPEEGEQQEVDYIDLPGGGKIERDEAAKGYLRQSDYSRKTGELAKAREVVSAEATNIERIAGALVDHLSSLVPAAPDASLAMTDPNAWTRQKAQHDAAMAKIQELTRIKKDASDANGNVDAAEAARIRSEQNQLLAQRFPQTADVKGKGRQEFFDAAANAAKEAGFTDQELGQVLDHRLFTLAYWAARGRKAEQASKTARTKVAKAPPVTPSQPGHGAKVANNNRQAMRKLGQTGSFQDAMKVDFD